VSSMNTRFALNVHRAGRTQEPAAHVFLQSIVRHANGMLSVTPVCTTLEELELQIEALKRELDQVLQQGRRAFTHEPGRVASS
jgi:hypothetical protein